MLLNCLPICGPETKAEFSGLFAHRREWAGLSRQLLVVTICDDPNQPDWQWVGGIYNNYLYIIITITVIPAPETRIGHRNSSMLFLNICATTAATVNTKICLGCSSRNKCATAGGEHRQYSLPEFRTCWWQSGMAAGSYSGSAADELVRVAHDCPTGGPFRAAEDCRSGAASCILAIVASDSRALLSGVRGLCAGTSRSSTSPGSLQPLDVNGPWTVCILTVWPVSA